MDPFIFILLFLPALFGWMYLQTVLDKSITIISPTTRFIIELLIYIAIAFYAPMLSVLVFTVEGFIGLVVLRFKDMFELKKPQ